MLLTWSHSSFRRPFLQILFNSLYFLQSSGELGKSLALNYCIFISEVSFSWISHGKWRLPLVSLEGTCSARMSVMRALSTLQFSSTKDSQYSLACSRCSCINPLSLLRCINSSQRPGPIGLRVPVNSSSVESPPRMTHRAVH